MARAGSAGSTGLAAPPPGGGARASGGAVRPRASWRGLAVKLRGGGGAWAGRSPAGAGPRVGAGPLRRCAKAGEHSGLAKGQRV